MRSPSTTARKPSASRRDLVLSPSSVSNAVAPTSRHQSDSPADLQSRISSTSRSKTQHQAAKSSFSPDPAQTSMPSRTPILKGRSVSPGASPSLTINSSEGRDSPDLDQGVRIREGFIKNELPPFRMLPQEALRIAEQGHDIPEEDEAYHVDHSTDEEDEADVRVAEESGGREKRKRADTLRGDESPDKAAGRMNGAAIGLGMRPSTSTSSTAYTTLPRSSTSIGLGRPPSTRRIQGAGRSVSSKTAQSKTISSGAPRSASMNILASSSSRGVRSSRQDAGESGSPDMASDENYWQNVVVPNVVKRMAVSKEMGYLYCEGDLVLEKDKSGTPLKWIKQEDVQVSPCLTLDRPYTRRVDADVLTLASSPVCRATTLRTIESSDTPYIHLHRTSRLSEGPTFHRQSWIRKNLPRGRHWMFRTCGQRGQARAFIRTTLLHSERRARSQRLCRFPVLQHRSRRMGQKYRQDKGRDTLRRLLAPTLHRQVDIQMVGMMHTLSARGKLVMQRERKEPGWNRAGLSNLRRGLPAKATCRRGKTGPG